MEQRARGQGAVRVICGHAAYCDDDLERGLLPLEVDRIYPHSVVVGLGVLAPIRGKMLYHVP